MGKKIYCGNLDYGMSTADLEQLFLPFGVVRNCEVIIDRSTGQSKGFGFVEMERDADAEAAIRELNDKTQEGGRPLKVNEARPREARRGGGGGGGRKYGGGGGGRRW